ncbi:MAG: hypothetical protein OXE46_07040 [Chloroflexi bacterium]|nr:hypothetical protein [Chloroflexota bacterium]
MAIIAANVSLIVCFAVLSHRRWLERGQPIKALAQTGLAIVLLIVVLLTRRGMQWQSYVFLWLSMHCILVVAASLLSPRLPGAMVKRFGYGIGLLYAVTWLGSFAVVLAANLTSDHNHGRIYAFIPFLIAWSGLAWGLYFGFGFKVHGGSLRIVRAGALGLVVILCAGIVMKTWRVYEPMKAIAAAFDERHELIMNAKADGLRDIEVPASLDLTRALREGFCTLEFYDIDSLSYTGTDDGRVLQSAIFKERK